MDAINQNPTAENMQIFSSAQFGQIRTTIADSGEPLFCLSDLCKAINVSNYRNVAKRIDQEGVRRTDILTNGGIQQVLFVTEPGMYEVLLRSDSENAKPFRKWVCSEVLPSIRKTGGYIASAPEESPEQIMARALLVAQRTIEQNKQRLQMLEGEKEILEEQNRLLAPKASYTDDVLQASSTYTFTQMAKELNFTGVQSFMAKLKELKLIFKQSGQWQLTAKYAGKRYTTTRTARYFRSDGTPDTSVSTVWTERGRMFLHNFFANNNMV